MPGTEKVLDKGGRTREWHVWANTVPALPGLPVPQGASLSKLGSELSTPPGSQPQLSGPQACPDTGAESFGKNQCHGPQAAGPRFPGLHRIPATTRASPCLQDPEKMLFSDAGAQPVPA